MQSNYFKSLFLFFTIALFSACTSSTTTVVVTSDATFTSLVLVNSKIANIGKAVFTLNSTGDTIVNLDSLPVGTKLDKLIPVFSFKSSSKAVINDSINYTGKDSVNFTQIRKVLNTASDQKASKLYYIKVNVHKVKPELYNWVKLDSSLNVLNAVSQKAVLLNNKIYYFMNDGLSTTVQTSIDGKNWDPKQTLTGLSNSISLQNMTAFNGKLYLALNDSKLYSTTNGINWVGEQFDIKYAYKSLLFTLNDHLWFISQTLSDGTYHLGRIKANADTLLVYKDNLPANFPLTDFTSLSFTSRTDILKGIVLGGKDVQGNVLKTNWNTEDGVVWVNFSRDSRSLDNYSLLGTSVISYDNKLLLFGEGVNTTANANYLVSKDEGFSWNLPDSSFNYLQKDTAKQVYKTRSYQSVLVQNVKLSKDFIITDNKNDFNNIFIIGGKVASAYSPQVWKGKLNRLNFIRQ